MSPKDQKAIISASKAGGGIAKSYFGPACAADVAAGRKVLNVEEKSCITDFRTQADMESESAIIAILEKSFPSYNILSEERGFIDKKSEYTFYIDPLDGTNNFFLGIPNFSVSIGLAKGEETIFGVVYLPMIDVVYSAEKGKGAFCNGVKIKSSSETSIANSASSFMCGYHCPKSYIIKTIGNLSRRTKRVLVSWSVASDLCLLASGKIETAINKKTEIYDFLAGKIIAKEAGCVVTDMKGKPEKNDFNREFLISNNFDIHREVLRLVL